MSEYVDFPSRCFKCGHALQLETGALGYNTHTDPTAAEFGHIDCLPGMWYCVEFDRLLRDGLDGPRGWRRHLHSKVWFDVNSELALLDALDFATTLKQNGSPEPVRLMKSVTASIPRRQPRTPDNPRAITAGTRARVMERDGFRCRRCGGGPSDSPLVVDHIVAVAKGGTAAFDNLQTLCRICNAGKSDREPTSHDLRGAAKEHHGR